MAFDRDSFAFRALLLASLIWMAVGFAFLGQEQQPTGQQEQSSSAPKSKEVETPKTFVAKLLDDPTAFFTMALAALTAALAGTAAAQIYYLRRTDETATRAADAAFKAAEAAERSADVARDTLIASNRGWLKVKIIGSNQPLRFSPNGASFSVSIAAENVGDAPAHHVQPHAWLLVWRTEPGKDPQTEHERRCAEITATSGGFTMFPGDTYPAVANVGGMHLGVSITAEEVRAGMAATGSGQDLLIFVGGCISYTSVAGPGTVHKSKFFYEVRTATDTPIRPSDGPIQPQGLVLWIGPFGHGNDAT